MDVISCNSTGSPSVLNPKAPMFVPAAYRAVEDFSGEWWDLVHSSPWFRDYWLQECFQDPENTPVFSPNDDHVLDDLDSLLRTSTNTNTNTNTNQESKERHCKKDLVTLGVFKWRNMRALAETPRYAEKAPKIVNKKVIPRPIQQPR